MTAEPSVVLRHAAESAAKVTGRPLTGFRVGITSARKVEELTALLERRGAEVESAPAMAIEATCDVDLRAATETVIAVPPAVFVATTGLGLRRWFEAASAWGLLPDLVAALGRAEIVARGPKAVGALRTHGLRELWSPPSECFEDVLTYLRGSSLAGRRIVVQEHGRSLSVVANALRLQGGDVQVVSVYRCGPADDQAAMFRMVDLVAEREVDAVTFTSAPAVEILMDVAVAAGRRADVLEAFRSDVLAACVGPVTAAPFEMWGVPSVQPARSRLAAMVRTLEQELPSRRRGHRDRGERAPAADARRPGVRRRDGGAALTRAAGRAARPRRTARPRRLAARPDGPPAQRSRRQRACGGGRGGAAPVRSRSTAGADGGQAWLPATGHLRGAKL